MMRWDIINALIEKNKYTSYLELGYYKGWSFDQVNCEDKTAVDPNPSKTLAEESMKYGETYFFMPRAVGQSEVISSNKTLIKLTSDDFFKEEKKATQGIGGAVDRSLRKWDIIFIDGLHEWEQVCRDIDNSIKHLSDNGLIVLHDCNPPEYKHTTTGIDGCWTGDAYKAVLLFKEQHPWLSDFVVVDTDWGVGVLPKSVSIGEYHAPLDRTNPNFRKGIDDWEYFNENRKGLLDLITVERFKEMYL